MDQFIIRVELKNADSETYDILHKEMYARKFVRTIREKISGKLYKLPDAEYYYQGDFSNDQILRIVQSAVNTTGISNRILITKAQDIIYSGLDQVLELN